MPFRRRAMRRVIVAQCFGCTSLVAFRHGLILLFLAASGFSSVTVMICLACPYSFRFALTVPVAYWADALGKKRLGVIGLVLSTAGFSLMAAGPLLNEAVQAGVVVAGVLAFSLGDAITSSSWFGLLSPIVPEDERGRFFGRLRFSWQSVGIAFFVAASFFLTADSPPTAFVPLLLAIAGAQVVKLVVYRFGIPELERPRRQQQGFLGSLLSILRAQGYMSFCSYVFLLALATAGCPFVFGLIEKKVLLLSDSQVVWLGNLGMIGAVSGFLFGGRAIDRWGTKPVFLVCHFGYGVVLFGFLFRGIVTLASMLPVYLGALHFAFGAMIAASSVAVSTEMLALIPPQNKSVSTSICTTLLTGGGALSSFLVAGALKVRVISEEWHLWGMALSSYDGALLACAIAVVLLVVTLGLVPSVIGKAQWVPRST